MLLYQWRRLLVMVIGLSLVSVTAAGCGLFGGGGEPEPQVVDPPPTATQSEAEQTTTPAAAEEQPEQESQPAEAVQVTTAPSQDEQEQAAEPEPVEPEPVESEPETYVVQAGDTLAGIANRLGVRIDDLITLNGIQDPDVLHVGQVLLIPREDDEEPTPAPARDSGTDAEDDAEVEDESTSVQTPTVELPNVAVPAATPTLTSSQQFPQPGIDETLESIPDPPSNFLEYGAAALPWLHGETTIDAIIELFKAWPMPALAVGNDRVYLIDTDADQIFSLAIVYTNPNSFGAAVPFSNLVVYDPVPGRADRYRIAYDHALAYGREVQGIVQLGDADMTGDDIRDITFREITCNETGCVSSFYVLKAEGDGYRVYTGSDAIVADVSWTALEDRSGDGAADLIVEGLATDEVEPTRYVFTFVAEDGELREALRVEATE